MNANREYAATNSSSTSSTSASGSGAGHAGAQPLSRPASGRMLAGVAAGIARTFGIDPVIVRVAFLVLALAGPGVPLYVAGWLLVPDEESGESVAAELIRSVPAGR
jgi:phage shock protein PspC (stress-responsive transcriptional regulator)